MKYLIYIITLISIDCISQQIYFNKTVDLQNHWGSGLSVKADSNRYICASITGPGKLISMIEIDSSGNLNNLMKYGLYGHSYYAGGPGSLDRNSDNQYVLAGSDDNGYNDTTYGLLFKFNQGLDTIWMKLFTSTVNKFLSMKTSKCTSDSGFIVGGDIYIGGYNTQLILIKTDSAGNELWRRLYGSKDSAELVLNVCETKDNGFILGGYRYLPGNDYSSDPIIIKTDSAGIIEWEKSFGGVYSDNGAVVSVGKDGNLLVTYAHGIYQDTLAPYPGPSIKQIHVIKLKANGEVLWRKIFSEKSTRIKLFKLIELYDESIIGVGFYRPENVYQDFGLLIKTNYLGDSIWWRRYEYSNEFNMLHDVDTTHDNGFILCGETYGAETINLQNVWIVKVDSNGCDTPGCDPTVKIPEIINCNDCELVISPNPAYEWFVISSSLLLERESLIEVFDLYGRRIKEVKVPVIENSCRIITDGWREGMYIIKLQNSNGVSETAKLIIGG